MKNLKNLLFDHCENHINNKLKNYLKIDQELFKSLNEETKSSAGDKHETTRAMIQIEREKLGKQISLNEQVFKKLISFEKNINTDVVCLGSIVITDNLNYYLSIPAGFLKIESKMYYFVSPISPIGMLLLGKKIKDQIYFNKRTSKILEIK